MKTLISLFFAFLFLSACNEFSAPIDEKNNASFPDNFQTKKALEKPDSVQTLVMPKTYLPDERLTALSNLMAGISQNDNAYFKRIYRHEMSSYFENFEKNWQNLENKHLLPLRTWLKTELHPKLPEKYNVLYPFSGPDILNALEVYPDAENYLLFGLENIGNLPAKDTIPTTYLLSLRDALEKTFRLNYFITANMSEKLREKGVTPLLLIFLARLNYDIVAAERIVLQKNGTTEIYAPENEAHKNLIKGVHVRFMHPEKKKLQNVYFFKGNIADNGMPKNSEIITFLDNFPEKYALLKSASYLLHGAAFNNIRNYLLNKTSLIMQDDTGIPYRFFLTNSWNVNLYGNYVKPVATFNKLGNYYQTDLQTAYETEQPGRLPFSFGYHGGAANTSVFVARKFE